MADTITHKVLTLPPGSPCVSTINNYDFAQSFYTKIINPLVRLSDSFIIPVNMLAVKGSAGICKLYIW